MSVLDLRQITVFGFSFVWWASCGRRNWRPWIEIEASRNLDTKSSWLCEYGVEGIFFICWESKSAQCWLWWEWGIPASPQNYEENTVIQRDIRVHQHHNSFVARTRTISKSYVKLSRSFLPSSKILCQSRGVNQKLTDGQQQRFSSVCPQLYLLRFLLDVTSAGRLLQKRQTTSCDEHAVSGCGTKNEFLEGSEPWTTLPWPCFNSDHDVLKSHILCFSCHLISVRNSVSESVG